MTRQMRWWAVALALLATACPKRLTPMDALSASKDVAQALSDAYTAWFLQQMEEVPDADVSRLVELDGRFSRLMEAYRVAATATYLALKRGEVPSHEMDKALLALLHFLRSQQVPLPGRF